MKTRTWIVLFAAAALLLGGLSVLLLTDRGDAQQAEILSDGIVIRTVRLDEDQTFSVKTADGGYNIICVEDGTIYVSEASCPDKVCIRHGPAAGGAPIVCLPNKLVVRFRGDGGADAITG